jgi:hypothetical protein
MIIFVNFEKNLHKMKKLIYLMPLMVACSPTIEPVNIATIDSIEVVKVDTIKVDTLKVDTLKK